MYFSLACLVCILSTRPLRQKKTCNERVDFEWLWTDTYTGRRVDFDDNHHERFVEVYRNDSIFLATCAKIWKCHVICILI